MKMHSFLNDIYSNDCSVLTVSTSTSLHSEIIIVDVTILQVCSMYHRADFTSKRTFKIIHFFDFVLILI